jgi:cellulose synthase/poly-beta-1,6-N-acetylglucosamine synthase-like glycosyltransferase
MAGDATPIGERLTASGAVSPEAVAAALDEQRRTGSRLGEILLASGELRADRLAPLLAEQWNLPLLEDAATPAPEALDAEIAWRLAVVPVHSGGAVRFATSELLHPLQVEELREAAGHADLVITTPQRVKELATAAYREAGLERATFHLRDVRPEASASRVLSAGQKLFTIALLVIVAICAVLSPLTTATVLLAIATTYYLLNSLYKFRLAFDSLSGAGNIPVSDEEVAALDERTLPRYTVLVPLYKEAAIVSLLTHNIRRLDYPAAKLEVLLLCEEDDDDTIDALIASDLPDNYHLIRVPDGQPRTKPRACNYGLLLARGQLAVIYDAEDRPDPDQLKKVVIGFSKTRGSLACIQGKLNYFNRNQNLLTRWFAAEYAMWFDLVLPGLHFNRHPIPLGGTSNHFLTEVLRELDAWDPFNVTEDADLGIRLWQRGYETAMVDSVTLEETNSATGNWVRQRSRWIKGYIQTWLVHMRHPWRLMRSIGVGPWLSLQMTVGGILVTLFNPVFWFLAALFLIASPEWLRDLFPGVLFYIAAAQLVIGNFVHVYLFFVGLGRREYWDVIPSLLIVPVYWMLMSVAGWKGALQLFTKPFYWEKTEHGLVDAHAYLDTPS